MVVLSNARDDMDPARSVRSTSSRLGWNTPEHTADQHQLRQLQHQRDQLNNQRREVVRAAQQTRAQLTDAPRWARARRRDLTDTLTACDSQLQQHPEQLAPLDTQITQVTSRLEAHQREWTARRDADNRTPRWPAAVVDPLGQLTRPTLSARDPPARRAARP